MDTLPGDKKDAKVLQSTISRFACRILVDRNEPYKARIYAAGFDSSRNIFLGVSNATFLHLSTCQVRTFQAKFLTYIWKLIYNILLAINVIFN